MYLSKAELETLIKNYGYESLIMDAHYQVEPDVWVYLFHDLDDKKYVLVVADYPDFDFDYYPHLLRFDNGEFHKIDFVLQREIPSRNPAQTDYNILFEYA